MYEKIFTMKFLPPGRGLWAMGTAITDERELFAALNNCAFVSTEANNTMEFIRAFEFLMDSSMLGIGTGFDIKGKARHRVYSPVAHPIVEYAVPDTREGWVDSLRMILKSYLVKGQSVISFDYSKLRPAGTPLKTFGGESAGPAPLMELHQTIRGLFEKELSRVEEPLLGTR